jgi:general secretion pathway protein G
MARRVFGLTLLELVLGIAIVSVLVAVAVPAYTEYRERVRVKQAITELRVLSVVISNYHLDARVYPDSLGEVAAASKPDPWGRPYVYVNLQDAKSKGKARKNKNLVPINSDFDLYSLGKDGASTPPLTAKTSRDDVIRANDGRYYGLGSNYE